MMIKSTKILLLVLMAMVVASQTFAANYSKDDYVYKYYIEINNQTKGLLVMSKIKNSFVSEYFGVTEDDRLPFYSRKKEGTFKDGLFATSVTYDGEKFDVYYDKKNAPPEIDEYLRGDASQKAIIWNPKTGRPRLSFEKIPAVTIENILIGLMNGTFKVGGFYYLLEGSKNAGVRLYSEKDEMIPLDVSDIKCATTSYLVKRTNVPGEPDVPLFRVVLNKDNVPLRIISNSGRWGLRLGGVSRGPQSIQIDSNNKLLENARKDFYSKALKASGATKDLSPFNFTMQRQNSDVIFYSFDFKTNPLISGDDRSQAAKLLAERLSGSKQVIASGITKEVREDATGYYVEVKNEDVCDEYRKAAKSSRLGDVNSNCTTMDRESPIRVKQEDIVKTANQKNQCEPGSIKYKSSLMGSDKLLCTVAGEEKKFDLKSVLEAYLVGLNAEIKLKEFTVENRSQDRFDVQAVITKPEKVSPQQLEAEASKLLRAKITNQSYPTKLQGIKDVQYVRNDHGYRLLVDKGAVARYHNELATAACRQIAISLGSQSTPKITMLPGDSCQISGEIARNVRDESAIMESDIYKEYVDLKLTGKSIVKNGNIWSFDYLTGFEGFSDGCH